MILHNEALDYLAKGRVRLPNRMNFRGEGGSFSIQKFMLQILGTLNRAFEQEIDTKE